MSPRLRPRRRPRKQSVDFSRLWWLLATEAALQVVCRHFPPPAGLYDLRSFYGATLDRLARLRARARVILARREVIV